MDPLYILAGVVLVLVLYAISRPRPEQVKPTYLDWDDSDYDAPAQMDWSLEHPSAPAPRFEAGQYYTWEPIEDLLWAYGYSRDEISKQWNHNYIEVWRDGLHAAFDPQADTGKSDRWRREPSDEERRNAVWR